MSLDAFMEDPNLPLEQKMRRLFDDVQECTACELAKLSLNKPGDRLLGHGNPENHVIFIAQNPSFRRVRFKEPKIFGTWENSNDRLFIQMLAKVGIQRKDVFVTNIVKCSTSENVTPSRESIMACKKFIMREVTYVKPQLIVPIGGIALRAFKGKNNEWTKWSGVDVFGIWHPAYILRGGLEPHHVEYVKQNYLMQFKELAKHQVFKELKKEPFEVVAYP